MIFCLSENERGKLFITDRDSPSCLYISEVNPRFGGGYLHAYECGERFPFFLMNNMNGIVNKPCIGKYESGVYMMKYFDIHMMKMEE